MCIRDRQPAARITEPTFSGDLGLYKPMQLYRLSATSGCLRGKNGDYTGIGGGWSVCRLVVSGQPLSRASPLPHLISGVHKYYVHPRSNVGAGLLAKGPAQALKIFNLLSSSTPPTPQTGCASPWQSSAYSASLRRNTADRYTCLLYTSPSPRDRTRSRMPSSA